MTLPAPHRLNPLTWRGHKGALLWLWVMYAKPQRFSRVMRRVDQLGWLRRLRTSAILLVLASLWSLPVTLAVRAVLTTALIGHEWVWFVVVWDPLSGVFLEGIALGVAFGVVFSAMFELSRGIAAGLALGLAGGSLFGIAGGVTGGLALGLAFGVVGSIERSSAFHVIFSVAISSALTVLGGVITGVATVVALLFGLFRLYYLPIALALLWPRTQCRLWRWHPLAWDEGCLLPFPGLDRLLIDLHRHAPDQAWREIDRLFRNVPSRRVAVLSAWTTLTIRNSAEAPLDTLDHALSGLPEGDKGFLTQTPGAKTAAAAIAADARAVATRTRPLFRALAAERLVNRILAFQGTVIGYREPLASELRAASVQWLARAEAMAREAGVAVERAGIRQYFRAGEPVDREGEAFVARAPVLAELERQVLLAAGCPGLLLYGRRRMGKSTVLKGLEGLIPGEVLPLYVSLQNPQAGGDVAHFCGYLRQRITERLGLDVPAEERSDLPALMATLARADAALAAGDRRLLLALDEYETIDQRVAEGRFPPDILAALRESIQTHRRIVWLFAGSHHIDELPHADWASHLISVRSVPVPMFTAAETRALLTNPLAHSPAFRVDDPRRPRIAEEFWGVDGIAWLHATAGGWPHLVQLLAEAVVDEVNDREAKAFESAWRGDLLDRAAGRGEMVLRQLLLGESRLAGEAAYLLGFAEAELQPPPADRAVARSLHRRELVAVTDDGWRLRVPLMRHWLVMNRHLL